MNQSKPDPVKSAHSFPRNWFGSGNSICAEPPQPYLVKMLGSTDLKQQITAQKALSNATALPWDEVIADLGERSTLPDPSLFAQNLAPILFGMKSKGNCCASKRQPINGQDFVQIR